MWETVAETQGIHDLPHRAGLQRARRCVVHVVAVLAAVMLALGHGPPGQAAGPEPPTLLAPAADATLPQDNLWDECTIYGLAWEFAWQGADGAVRHELVVEREGRAAPYARVVADGTEVRVGRCGCLPADQLDGWRWRVRAGAADDTWSAWSGWRPFRVATLPICGQSGPEH